MPKLKPPTLPASAFAPAPVVARRLYPRGVIDAHVHLWTAAQLNSQTITWPQTEQLGQPHDLRFYSQVVSKGIEFLATSTPVRYEGFVFVQAEVQHDDSDDTGARGGWNASIEEVDSVCTAALTSNQAAETSARLLGMVPWVILTRLYRVLWTVTDHPTKQAPVLHGREALKAYFHRLYTLPSYLALSLSATSLSDTNSKNPPRASGVIKSCRYLVQSSPKGFLLEDKFIDGLKWLGEQGIAFDMTVDAGPDLQGPCILEEVISCILRVREGQVEGQQTRFVIDHFAKPDLISEPMIPSSDSQTSYIRSLYELALLPDVVLKLSALLDSADPSLVQAAFTEHCDNDRMRKDSLVSTSRVIPVQGSKEPTYTKELNPLTHQTTLEKRILTFLEPALEAFGDSRIIIGSDWPMFRRKLIMDPASVTKDMDVEAMAWEFEMSLYRSCLVQIGVEGEALDRIFSENAVAFYRL